MKERWDLLPISKACKLFTDGNWIETKDQSATGIRLVQTGNVGLGVFKDRRSKARFISASTFSRLKCQEVVPGDCLVSRLPDPVGRSCIVPETGDKMITAVDCTIIRFEQSKLIPEFFNYYSQSARYLSHVEAYCTGATRKRISRSNLGKIELPIPPLPEQKRIVAILDEAFAGIDTAIANTERNLANARALFESYLNSVFSQRGEGWQSKSVGEFAEHCLGKMLDKQKNKGEMRPYLRNLNVQWFQIHTDDVLEMRIEPHEEDRYSVKAGDLLICEGGYPGRAAIWEREDSIFFQKALHRVRCEEPLYNRWLLYYLYFTDSSGELSRHFTGAGIQHFTGKALKAFRVRLPPQEQISDLLDGIEAVRDELVSLEMIYQQKLTALAELKQSLLQKAFSGELTADQADAMATVGAASA